TSDNPAPPAFTWMSGVTAFAALFPVFVTVNPTLRIWPTEAGVGPTLSAPLSAAPFEIVNANAVADSTIAPVAASVPIAVALLPTVPTARAVNCISKVTDSPLARVAEAGTGPLTYPRSPAPANDCPLRATAFAVESPVLVTVSAIRTVWVTVGVAGVTEG